MSEESGTRTITQVTKTTYVQGRKIYFSVIRITINTQPLYLDAEEQAHIQQQQTLEFARPIESETWQSGEQDTSQVSVSSLPEDEESAHTATVSSATTVTTDEMVNPSAMSLGDQSGGTKITVEQNGKFFNGQSYRLITVYDVTNMSSWISELNSQLLTSFHAVFVKFHTLIMLCDILYP